MSPQVDEQQKYDRCEAKTIPLYWRGSPENYFSPVLCIFWDTIRMKDDIPPFQQTAVQLARWFGDNPTGRVVLINLLRHLSGSSSLPPSPAALTAAGFKYDVAKLSDIIPNVPLFYVCCEDTATDFGFKRPVTAVLAFIEEFFRVSLVHSSSCCLYERSGAPAPTLVTALAPVVGPNLCLEAEQTGLQVQSLSALVRRDEKLSVVRTPARARHRHEFLQTRVWIADPNPRTEWHDFCAASVQDGMRTLGHTTVGKLLGPGALTWAVYADRCKKETKKAILATPEGWASKASLDLAWQESTEATAAPGTTPCAAAVIDESTGRTGVDSSAMYLSMQDVKLLAKANVLQKAQDLYQSVAGFTLTPILSGHELVGQLQGSEKQPYEMKATVTRDGVVLDTCFCPCASRKARPAEACKHLLALLLRYASGGRFLAYNSAATSSVDLLSHASSATAPLNSASVTDMHATPVLFSDTPSGASSTTSSGFPRPKAKGSRKLPSDLFGSSKPSAPSSKRRKATPSSAGTTAAAALPGKQMGPKLSVAMCAKLAAWILAPEGRRWLSDTDAITGTAAVFLNKSWRRESRTLDGDEAPSPKRVKANASAPKPPSQAALWPLESRSFSDLQQEGLDKEEEPSQKDERACIPTCGDRRAARDMMSARGMDEDMADTEKPDYLPQHLLAPSMVQSAQVNSAAKSVVDDPLFGLLDDFL